MGADAPIPQMDDCRRPEGRPAAVSITYTKIRIQSLAQARPDEASRRLPASAGRGGITLDHIQILSNEKFQKGIVL